ncbi:hypothetical protein G6F22_015408 [Rhizopus arrhizus]|nr:hypothetical protein G6F22_015408 [Rhizopus arrhizus]
MCLLLGFQGKYLIEGQEKLGYLTARLGDEIALLRGKRTGFAPHWPLPDKIAHTLKRDVPLWSIMAVFALMGLLAFLGIGHFLNTEMQTAMAPYHDIRAPHNTPPSLPARAARLRLRRSNTAKPYERLAFERPGLLVAEHRHPVATSAPLARERTAGRGAGCRTHDPARRRLAPVLADSRLPGGQRRDRRGGLAGQGDHRQPAAGRRLDAALARGRRRR